MILLLFRNSNLLFKISIFVNDEGLNKIIIYNYKDIIDFCDKFVNVNNYIISGEKLVINKLEDSIIEIFGQIKKIEKKE